MGFLGILGMVTPLIIDLIKEFNILGNDDKNNVLSDSGETLEAFILALQKMKSGEVIDLAELKLEKTYEDVLAEHS